MSGLSANYIVSIENDDRELRHEVFQTFHPERAYGYVRAVQTFKGLLLGEGVWVTCWVEGDSEPLYTMPGDSFCDVQDQLWEMMKDMAPPPLPPLPPPSSRGGE